MTVSITNSQAVFGANGTQTVFPFAFWFFAATDIVVTLVELDGAVRVLSLTLDYTVTGVGDRSGGEVVLSVPPALGGLIIIRRVRPITQLTQLRNQGAWFPEVQEDAFDNIMMILQQLRYDLNRALSVNEHVLGINTLITPKSGHLIGWNSTGTGLENYAASSVGGGGGTGTGEVLSWDFDVFDGNGVQTYFQLSRDPGSINNTFVFVDGVYQNKDTYAVVAAEIQFSEAPPNLPRCIEVMSGSAATGGESSGGSVSGSSENVTFRQTSSSFTRSVSSKFKDYLSITDFGAVGLGGDDSAAMQATLNQGAALNAQGLYKKVWMPTGIYLMNSVTWDGFVPIEGENPQYTILRYNGDGAAGSTILNFNSSLKVSHPRISKLYFDGWDGVLNSGKVAENLFRNTGNGGWDFHGHFDSCTFLRCWGDAIRQLGNGSIVNMHFERLRFDSVGGYAIALNGSATTESRPVTLSRWSLDNNISGNFLTTAQTMGKYNGTNWGKGLMYVGDARGLNIKIEKGRAEFNKPLIDAATNKRCLINVADAGSGNVGTISIDDVSGFFQQRDAGIIVYDPASRVGFQHASTSFAYCSKYYESGTLTRDIPGSVGSSLSRGGVSRSSAGGVGAILNGSLFEARPTTAENQYIYYKLGDRITKSNSGLGDPEGYCCTAPTVGYTFGLVSQLTASAATTSGNAVVSWSADLNSGRFWGIGANIKLLGAGVAGADLTTYITAVDPNALTFTVNTAPSTTLGTCIVQSILPTWTPYGQVGYRSNAGTPVSVLTPKFIGERVLDSTNSVWYSAVGTGSTNWAKDSP